MHSDVRSYGRASASVAPRQRTHYSMRVTKSREENKGSCGTTRAGNAEGQGGKEARGPRTDGASIRAPAGPPPGRPGHPAPRRPGRPSGPVRAEERLELWARAPWKKGPFLADGGTSRRARRQGGGEVRGGGVGEASEKAPCRRPGASRAQSEGPPNSGGQGAGRPQTATRLDLLSSSHGLTGWNSLPRKLW